MGAKMLVLVILSPEGKRMLSRGRDVDAVAAALLVVVVPSSDVDGSCDGLSSPP
jgi:hypothetical protein